MANCFGNSITISIFGESHSAAIGVVMDGLPSGLSVDLDAVQKEMERRAPGRSKLATPRHEADVPHIVSGLFRGKTTGTPLCALIENANTRSGDYEPALLRPSHADFTALCRYHGYADYRGGGHFSGRLTAPLVFAGAVVRPWLQARGIEIFAHIQSIGSCAPDAPFDAVKPNVAAYRTLRDKTLPVLSAAAEKDFRAAIEAARAENDSVGGIIEVLITGLPAGLGSPFFESVESRLSALLFSVPAVKAVAFGDGFDITRLRGSSANDALLIENNLIQTKTNRSGGIVGGITNGMPVCFTVAVKPTPSIARPQQTVNVETKQNDTITIHGRHDPCIVPRAVCVAEACAALVTADLLQEAKTYADPAPQED